MQVVNQYFGEVALNLVLNFGALRILAVFVLFIEIIVGIDDVCVDVLREELVLEH